MRGNISLGERDRLEQGGCGEGRDARSSLLAEPWWLPPACRSASLGSGSQPSGFVPFHGHPNGFGAQHEAGDLLGQGEVLSTTPDGLRHPLR